MNIIQQHERVRFLIDQVATSRFDSEDVDNAINGEIEMLVNEKYDQAKAFHKQDAFQLTQRLRDELHELVKYIPFDHDDSLIAQILVEPYIGYYLWLPSTLVDEYRHLLSLKIKMTPSGAELNAKPISQDELNVREKNPFRRVRSGAYPRMYYHETARPDVVPSGKTWQLIYDESGGDSPVALGGAEYYYLMNPTIVNYGVEYGPSQSFANGTPLIAVAETVYNGTTYVIGEKIYILSSPSNITSGLVVHNFVETELSPSLHEEICRRAASSLLISAGESEKAKEILVQVF